MILQACIDDSGTATYRKDRLYLLGGFIAEVVQWAKLTNAWEAELLKPPGAAYFKMSQALSLKDEFDREKGWTESLRDERILALADIAVQHVEMPIAVWVNHVAFDAFVRDFCPRKSRFEHLRDPYFLLFHHITEIISRHKDLFPDMQELQYVFDEKQHIGEMSREFWKVIRRKASDGGVASFELIGSTPNLMDDKKFIPLQAADLYAGASRADLDGDRRPLMRNLAERFNTTRLQAIGAEYDRDNLLRLGADLILRRALG